MIEDLGLIYATDASRQRCHYALYECPLCGRILRDRVSRVKSTNKQNCGCKELTERAKNMTTHGLAYDTIYNVYKAMMSRCYNEKNTAYNRYGGRGITVCEEWKNDIMSFYNWAKSNGHENGLEIDRENNDGNYEPSNCRWVTPSVNSQNRRMRSDNTIGYKGVKRNGKKWQAHITINKTHINLGSYITKEEAALAYNKYAIEHKTCHLLNTIV